MPGAIGTPDGCTDDKFALLTEDNCPMKYNPDQSDDDCDGDSVSKEIDVDDDDDGLIEIHYLEDLDYVRYNLAGTSYKTSATASGNTSGLPAGGLNGYELARSLDFNEPTSYRSGVVNTNWTTGMGWEPIGDESNPFNAIFNGNGKQIKNLMINRNTVYIGLFGYIASDSLVHALGLVNAQVGYKGRSFSAVGALAGRSDGTIVAANAVGGMATGNADIDSIETIGGLVGENSGMIIASYATGDINGFDGSDVLGGLVGCNNKTIVASYAMGDVIGGVGERNDWVGGLVGQNGNCFDPFVSAMVVATYATGNTNGSMGIGNKVGGLMGRNLDTFTASYATGFVDSGSNRNNNLGADGLVGENVVSTNGEFNASIRQAMVLVMYYSGTDAVVTDIEGFDI